MARGSEMTPDIIEFVRRTTEAITVISESTKQIGETTGAIKEMISTQNATNAKAFEGLSGDNRVLNNKVDGLKQLFQYVIIPLVTGILALVGIKMFFKL